MCEARALLWDEYARLQGLAERYRKLSRPAWGTDEALSALVSQLATLSSTALEAWVTELAVARSARLRRLISEADALRTWLKNIAGNRSRGKKYESSGPVRESTLMTICQPDVSLIRAQEVHVIRSNSNSVEWFALWALANGHKYQAVAAILNMRVGTLKSIISRRRARLACGA